MSLLCFLGSQTSQLYLQGDYREFDYIDVTGEYYWDAGTCTELVDTPFYFQNMTIINENGDYLLKN